MNEKMKILEMLSQGKITTDEAMLLLEQIGEQKGNGPRPESGRGEKERRDFDFSLGGLGETIGNAVRDGIGALEDIDVTLDLSDIFIPGHKGNYMYTSPAIGQNITALRLLGKNDKIEITGHDGKDIRIFCEYKAKRHDVTVGVSEDGGVYELLYDYNAMRSMKIYCHVPRNLIEELNAETKNAKIILKDVKAGNIALTTKNDKIELARVAAAELNLQTSNSKIDIESVTAQNARLVTSNAKIATENIDIKHMYVKTSNSGIKLENIFGIDSAERTIEAHTSNGGISMFVPHSVAVSLQASTSNSSVTCHLPNMLTGESKKNYVNCKSQNYDTAANRAKINVSTSNGAIKIREQQ